VKPARIVAAVLILGGTAFGLWGGEYNTGDWLTLRRQVRAEHAAIDSLHAALDSLRRDAVAIERDPATQERVAREQFGMIRPGEILYRIEGAALDSTGR
jgi:cell division protein FtsB